jgi:pyridoxal phosphate enzyme (YggS family)
VTTLPRPVTADPKELHERLEAVRGRVAGASVRSGRAANAVTLIGVVKTVPSPRVAEAVRLGLLDLGENRVQEAEQKIPAVAAAAEGGQLRWHRIGHLPRNKAARAARLFDRVHSVDGLELALALGRAASEAGRTLAVMIEVNVSGEPAKFGVAPGELEALAGAMARLEALRLDGLMTVGPRVERPEDARTHFAALRRLRDETEQRMGVSLPHLSMGMSGDFEVAIEEGSTMVRVGTAIFGERD